MFPEVSAAEIATEAQETETMGKSLSFNFSTGDFDLVAGKLIKTNGLAALKGWIEKVLRTERFKFKIYEKGNYGISLSDFVNSDYSLDFKKAEIEREVREALLKNSDILSVHSFSFERVKRALQCTFTVDTKYGQTGGEIRP